MNTIITYNEKFLGVMYIELDKDSKVTELDEGLHVDKATYTWIGKDGKRHRYRDFDRILDKNRII